MIMPLLLEQIDGHSFLVDIIGMNSYVEQELSAMTTFVMTLFPEHAVAYQNQTQIVDFLKSLEDHVLKSVNGTTGKETSKKRKLKTLAILQVFLFRHLFSMNFDLEGALSERVNCADVVSRIVQNLLQDPVLEVRQYAATTMSGVVRCNESINSDRILALKSTFENWIAKSDIGPTSDITLKHAGVLGLCSLVVSYPYDIPKWLPDVLVILAKHSSKHVKNQHIQSSIRTTFADFRRTHQDRWAEDVVGQRDDYREVYGNPVAHAESFRSSSPLASNKGIFTAYHLDQLEGLLQGNTASYLA